MSSFKELYKGSNKAKNSDERARVTVELRKNKREDLFTKRRNMEEVPAEGQPEQPELPDGPSTVEDRREQMQMVITEISSQNPKREMSGVVQLRKYLSLDGEFSDPEMIRDSGVLPLLLSFVNEEMRPKLQMEAAWSLTNITAGPADNTTYLIREGGLPVLLGLLKDRSVDELTDQVLWTLSNVAGDDFHARQLLWAMDLVKYLVFIMEQKTTEGLRKTVTWLMANLTRDKPIPPDFEKAKPLVPILVQQLHSTNTEIIFNSIWAFYYIFSQGTVEKIQCLLDSGILPRLVELLDIAETENEYFGILLAVTRTIGLVALGDDAQSGMIMTETILAKLKDCLTHPRDRMVHEATWIVSNLTAGSRAQVLALMNYGIIKDVCAVLNTGTFHCQKEAVCVVANMINRREWDIIQNLIEHYDFIDTFCKLLSCCSTDVILTVLKSLRIMLQIADGVGRVEMVHRAIERCEGFEAIERAQSHDNVTIYDYAFDIMDKFASPANEPMQASDTEIFEMIVENNEDEMSL